LRRGRVGGGILADDESGCPGQVRRKRPCGSSQIGSYADTPWPCKVIQIVVAGVGPQGIQLKLAFLAIIEAVVICAGIERLRPQASLEELVQTVSIVVIPG
jgi:hypothetical protein